MRSRVARILIVAKSLVLVVTLLGLNCRPIVGIAENEALIKKRNSAAFRLRSWDVGFYLRLAKSGYEPESSACAFYPLWPATIRLSAVLTGVNPMMLSIGLANVFSILAFWLLYGLIERKLDEEVALKALILFLAFPGALFFCVSYTESLYLLLLLICFWGLENGRFWWVAVGGFLLPLTRPVGIFIVFPLAWHTYQSSSVSLRAAFGLTEGPKANEVQHLTSTSERICGWTRTLLLLFPLAGYATYFGVMYAWTGNALEGFQAQRFFPNSPSIHNMFNVRGFLGAFLNGQSFMGMRDSVFDRCTFVTFLALLPAIHRMSRTWFWYALPVGLIPAMTNWFLSYRRFIVVCFPVFIVIAQALETSDKKWAFWYYVILLAALQVWQISEFVSSNWAG